MLRARVVRYAVLESTRAADHPLLHQSVYLRVAGVFRYEEVGITINSYC